MACKYVPRSSIIYQYLVLNTGPIPQIERNTFTSHQQMLDPMNGCSFDTSMCHVQVINMWLVHVKYLSIPCVKYRSNTEDREKYLYLASTDARPQSNCHRYLHVLMIGPNGLKITWSCQTTCPKQNTVKFYLYLVPMVELNRWTS